MQRDIIEIFSQSFELNQSFKAVRKQTIYKTNKKRENVKKKLRFQELGLKIIIFAEIFSFSNLEKVVIF